MCALGALAPAILKNKLLAPGIFGHIITARKNCAWKILLTLSTILNTPLNFWSHIGPICIVYFYTLVLVYERDSYLDFFLLLNYFILSKEIIGNKKTTVKGLRLLKSVHFKKPVTRSSFLSKSVVIFNITTTNMTTLFERNEDRLTGFLK